MTETAKETKSVDKSVDSVTPVEPVVEATTLPSSHVKPDTVEPATEAVTSPSAAVEPDTVELEAEADDYNGDADSAIGSDGGSGSSTHSVNSSIRAYRQENGRTYHAYKEGKYYMPNDETESERLDLQHHLLSLTFNNALITCPITIPLHRALDVGTGTGIWAVDFADEHPECEVVGIDLSPIQPEFVSPNLYFEIDDIEEDWTFNQKFDLVHARMMIGSLADWPRFFKQSFDNLNHGGYIQLVDVKLPIACDDDTMLPTGALTEWSTLWLDGCAKAGRPGDCAKDYKRQLEEAGFVDVVQTIYKWPTNMWPKTRRMKELGMWSQANIMDGIMPITLAIFTRVLGWSVPEIEVFLVNVRNELRDTKIHAYFEIYVVYGRRP